MTNTTANQGGGQGIQSVDLLRGFVMLLVALDLIRFYTLDASYGDPMNLDETTVGLFFSRWITYYFAPLFLLLAGTTAFFRKNQGMTTKQLSVFLLTRGLFLIALEVLVVGFLWKFQFNIYPIYFQLIWVLGLSMVALAGLVWLPVSAIAGISLAVIFGHNLLDGFDLGSGYWQNIAWGILHQEAAVCLDICQHNKETVYYAFFFYPLLPWGAVVGLGYALGSLYQLEAKRRRKILLLGGLAATLLFLVVRALGGYGNPMPWAENKNSLWTIMSFLNTQKYPPSLAYLLMTLGPGLMLLAWFETVKLKAFSFFRVFGQVPVFSYLLIFLVAHTLALIIGVFQGFAVSDFQTVPWRFPEEYGLGLGWVYLIWVIAALALYPICDWYADLRARKPGSLLRYL